MTEFNLPELECFRCGHRWNPRANKLPKVCPKCKNPNWNRLRTEKKQQEERNVS